ncbi:hypothetical protein O3P69_011964 [Scylla paramamosain]|uniref:Uncharacterized protein n=1 Tax=Scylla paramamosain TaxID=85552 RepID=A0AAW0SIE6_SCYPA
MEGQEEEQEDDAGVSQAASQLALSYSNTITLRSREAQSAHHTQPHRRLRQHWLAGGWCLVLMERPDQQMPTVRDAATLLYSPLPATPLRPQDVRMEEVTERTKGRRDERAWSEDEKEQMSETKHHVKALPP